MTAEDFLRFLKSRREHEAAVLVQREREAAQAEQTRLGIRNSWAARIREVALPIFKQTKTIFEDADIAQDKEAALTLVFRGAQLSIRPQSRDNAAVITLRGGPNLDQISKVLGNEGELTEELVRDLVKRLIDSESDT